MTFDIGINLVGTVLGIGCIIVVLVLATGNRTTKSQALRSAWEAWRSVSERALEKGQPVPPPPGEHHGKR
jgi:hypothetical protein